VKKVGLNKKRWKEVRAWQRYLKKTCRRENCNEKEETGGGKYPEKTGRRTSIEKSSEVKKQVLAPRKKYRRVPEMKRKRDMNGKGK